MEDEIKSLEDKLKRMKLEKQLSKLGGSVKKEEKKEVHHEKSDSSKMQEEIKELEAKKQNQKGFGGFIRKLSINKQINARRSAINAPRQINALKQGIEINELQTKYNESKKKAKASSKIFGNDNQPIKFIDTKDIFG